jgi:sorbose reductase
MVESIRLPNPPIEDSVFKMFRMDGKTVIISGGSGGIGYEVARGLAEAGANVNIPISTSPLQTHNNLKLT